MSKLAFVFLLLLSFSLPVAAQSLHPSKGTAGFQSTRDKFERYASINGLRLYYELHGTGRPLVLLHGGGSTLESTFGRILPGLAKRHRVIAIESQAHGRTPDIDRPTSFEQDADDVAGLLQQLEIDKADFFGFSNGGTTVLQVAIRHPQLVNRIVLASALYQRDGMPSGFFDGMRDATLESMPAQLKDAYLRVNPDPNGLRAMFERDKARMLAFKDMAEDSIRGIQAPALVLNGDQDVVRVEHAIALARALPHARLCVLPAGHGDYIGELSAGKDSATLDATSTLIKDFLRGE